jgi:hypothetical protein
MTSDTLQAVNCRIPKDTYEDMHTVIRLTQKTTGAFVKDAIDFYIQCVKDGTNVDFKSMKIDQFAYGLERESKKQNRKPK